MPQFKFLRFVPFSATFSTTLQAALFSLLTLMTVPALAEVIKTEANNGNLLMEDIPPIPDEIVEDLRRFQNIRSAPFRDWSADGESIYVTTRFGDVSQLHRVAQPGSARRQLTFFDEPLGSIVRQPKGSLVAFTMDAGGSEYAQIFIFNPATGDAHMITDGESRNGVVSWRRDGQALAFQSTQRNGQANDLWMAELDAEGRVVASKMILESSDGSWWGTGDWSADGSKMLVQQYVSITDSRIYLLDIASGERQLLNGDVEKPSVNYTVAFDADGAGHYFITDAHSEQGFAQLAYQKFASEEVEVLSASIPWDVEEAVMNEQRDRLAFAANIGGVSDLFLLDTQTGSTQKVAGLPIGLVRGLRFNPQSSKLGFTLNSASSPSDSYSLDLANNVNEAKGAKQVKNANQYGELTRWTFSEVGGLDEALFVRPQLIHYPTFDQVDGKQRQIPAFVYKPNTASAAAPAPVVISIHGGPESQFRPRFSSTYQLWVNKLGAAVVAPNVRGSSGYGRDYVSLDNGFKREDSVKDIGALLDWIATQPDLDASKVFVFGGSYGGYMVLASAVHYSDRLSGAVDIVGISNFVTFLKNTKDYRRDLRRVEYGDERDPEMYAHLQAISPNNQVDKISIPLLVVQGNNDPRVPVTEAEQIVKALREQGTPVWYMNALNEGHGYKKKENRDLYQQAVVLFFKQILEGQFSSE